MDGRNQEEYTRTLIHVLSLALCNYLSQSSIGYISSLYSSVLNQELGIHTKFTFVFSIHYLPQGYLVSIMEACQEL